MNKKKDVKRDVQITLWVTKKEKEKLVKLAEKDDRSLNRYILHKAIGDEE